ncbi:MAG: tRNA pseudouridine(38-40) synthase TruA [bacterium]|nr:tRNA pseudouridine(38-40) synthase TruA [bacterium]
MTRYRATLAYDGTAYFGFQRQKEGVVTVQSALEAAITRATGQIAAVTGAGRTDAGVHATGQVVSFAVEWAHDVAVLLRAVNAHLPDDIALQDIAIAPDGFHPRYSARSRVYRYLVTVTPQRQPLLRHRAWQLHQPLDVDRLQLAAAQFVGVHDFAAFGQAAHGENTVREVFVSRWERIERADNEYFFYEVEATAFLKHMVRRLVGVQVQAGQSRLTPEQVGEILREGDMSRVKRVAPPQGLTLVKVRYSDKNQPGRDEESDDRIAPCLLDQGSV